jgi:hypothetical protein
MGNGEWGMSFSFKWQIQYIGGVITMEISEQEWGMGNWEWRMENEWGMGMEIGVGMWLVMWKGMGMGVGVGMGMGMVLSFKRQIQHIGSVIAMEISEICQNPRIGFNSWHVLMEIPTIFITKSPNFWPKIIWYLVRQ